MSHELLERVLLAALTIALAIPLSALANRYNHHVAGTEIDLLELDEGERAEPFSPRDPKAEAFAWRTLRRLWWTGSTATVALIPVGAGVAILAGDFGEYAAFQKALFGGVLDAANDFVSIVRELPQIAEAAVEDPSLLPHVAYAAFDAGLVSSLDAIAIFFLHDDDAEAAHVAGAFVLMRWTSKALRTAKGSKLMQGTRFARSGRLGLGMESLLATRRAMFFTARETMVALRRADRFARHDLPSFVKQSFAAIRSTPRAIREEVTGSVPVRFGRTFFDRTATAAEVAASARDLGAAARAYAKGVVQGPFHILSHVAQPKVFVPIAATTTTLGVAFHFVGIDAAIVATPVLVGVTATRWIQVGRLLRHTTGTARYRIVGFETVLTIENASELLGVHILPHGDGHEPSDLHVEGEKTDAGNPLWTHLGRPALQGLLGFHDFFFAHVGHRDHAHDARDRDDGHHHQHGNTRPRRHR